MLPDVRRWWNQVWTVGSKIYWLPKNSQTYEVVSAENPDAGKNADVYGELVQVLDGKTFHWLLETQRIKVKKLYKY